MSSRDRKQQSRTRPESPPGAYAALPVCVIDSPEYLGASSSAKALLVELLRQHSGSNNGQLQLAFTWLAGRGWTSRQVIQRAKAELIARQLIMQTRQGGMNRGASKYALTWLSVTDFRGLDMVLGDYRRRSFHGALKKNLPVLESGKGSTARRYCAVPESGNGKASAVPESGTREASFEPSPVPESGKNALSAIPSLVLVRGSPARTGPTEVWDLSKLDDDEIEEQAS